MSVPWRAHGQLRSPSPAQTSSRPYLQHLDVVSDVHPSTLPNLLIHFPEGRYPSFDRLLYVTPEGLVEKFSEISTPETLCSQNHKRNNKDSKWRITAPNPAFVSSKLLSAYRLNLCFYASGFPQHHLYFHFSYASEWANHHKHCVQSYCFPHDTAILSSCHLYKVHVLLHINIIMDIMLLFYIFIET